MISGLFQLTVRGSVAFLLVLLLDALLARHMQAQSRRFWWIAVALAFLCFVKLPVLPPMAAPASVTVEATLPPTSLLFASLPLEHAPSFTLPLCLVWAVGTLFSLALLLGRTLAASRTWSGLRLCTDSALLEILEDCKRDVGISAPIGLVLTDRLATPAIFGWLRPRILLPADRVRELSPAQLRHVFLHELAHFRSLDVQVGWLFALARCIHWFNPFAYWAERSWTRFREEAADEQVLRWSGHQGYAETLVALVPVDTSVEPSGALALSETFPNLKHRIQLIMNHHRKKSRPVLALFGLAALGVLVALQTARAQTDDKAAVLGATQTWLQGIDAGNYAQSWKDASSSFQKALTEQQWVQALQSVRKPLGKLVSRQVASALHQTEIPSPGGTIKGDFYITQFDTTFENLKYAVETVTFEKDNGVWKASGYFIKPKS